MNRIFYFTGHRLKVFHWNGKSFSGAFSFEPDADGLDKFREYLQTAEKTPTKLVVDVIEEDFRKEVIPHVYGEDRKAVVSRLLDRHYRSSNQYTYYEILDRQKTGRRDDNVLIGGITNPYLIQPWVSIIKEVEIPLSGIWTLPLVSKKLLPVIGARKGPVLLVSQQVNSNLRQTFFRDGKMLSSRQSVINQDADDISNIGDFALPEVDRTIDFLRNQRLVEIDETVALHIIGSDEQIASLENKFESTALMKVEIHRLNDLHTKVGIKGMDSQFSDGLFAWLALRQWEPRGHYGEAREYNHYYYRLASSALYFVSVAVVLFALLSTESNISKTVEYERSIELLNEQASEYKKVYSKKFKELEPVFTHARSMNAAVDLADRIYRNSRVSPLDFMVTVSKALSKPEVGKLELDRIQWSVEQVTERRGVEVINNSNPDMTSNDVIRHAGIIEGVIDVSDDNYRGSVARVNTIINALLKNERILKVEAIEMPVEVRSEKMFSDEGGSEIKKTKQERTGVFSLKITMKAPDRV